ncbi:ATP-binding cassette domain-containing protein [Nocardioides zeae]|nr:ATP-binding cassette domain-containing protein [Nocardioides zeae]
MSGPPHDAPAIEVAGLVKQYGERRALDGLDLVVPAGGVHAVLGPNGAGKTTLVRVLTTLVRPDGGTARVLGHDVTRDAARVRSLVGLTGQYASVDELLTARQNLMVVGRLLGARRRAARERAAELLERFDLTAAADRQVRTFSGGMRRRLDIAASIVVQPRLLFLDEPTTGLDPRTRLQMWATVRDLVAGGTTVLLTTQYLEEADTLAGRISVVDHGRVVADDTPAVLKRSVGGLSLHLVVRHPGSLATACGLVERVVGVAPTLHDVGCGLSVPVLDESVLPPVVTGLREAGVEVIEVGVRPPALDDVFLALTGRAHPAPVEAAPVEVAS